MTRRPRNRRPQDRRPRLAKVETTLAFLVLGLIASLARANSPGASVVRVQFVLDPADVRLETLAAGTAVLLPGGVLTGRPGEPALPAVSRGVELPLGATAAGIRVVSLESITLDTPRLVPIDQPVIPGHEPAAPAPAIARDERIYASTGPFPAMAAELGATAWSAGQPIAMLRFFPVRYLPKDGQLLIHTRIVVEVDCDPAPSARQAPRALAGRRLMRPLWLTAAAHPGDAPPTPALAMSTPGVAEAVDPALRQYVIITTAELAQVLEPLAAWKTSKGIPAGVVTVEEIADTQPGQDLAAQVRGYLRSAFEAGGATYALLAGPPDQVGYRSAFAMDCQLGGPEVNAIPADLYFADLDGDWNADHDAIFGETADSVDLLPEIYVGRVTPGSLAQAEAWVAKVLDYEQNPPGDYQTNVLMLGEISFQSPRPYTDDGIGLDRLDDMYFDPLYDPITKLYESRGNESLVSVVQALNDGPHFVLHCGHGSPDLLSVGDGHFRTPHAAQLTNGTRSFLFYSVGCLAAAFDDGPTVLGELLLHAEGGGFASIGNTRYGWASPGNPGYGYSETFMQAFFRELLIGGTTQVGVALAQAKAGMIPFSGSENIYRWHQYCVNLLGDPEMPVYTRVPATLAISAPEIVPPGDVDFEALVTDGSGPVAGARVCLASGNAALYQVGFTDDAGRVRFAGATTTGMACTLTATAPNCVAAQASLTVSATTSPVLAVAEIEFDDDANGASSGNGDGEINAGERVELWVTLRNLGDVAAEGVTLSLSGEHAGFTVVASEIEAGSVTSGALVRATEPLVIDAGADLVAGEGTVFDLAIAAAGGDAWHAPVGVDIRAADPYVAACHAVEIAGDGDGVVEPGEQALLELAVGNRGNGTLPGVYVVLLPGDPFIEVMDRVTLFPGGLSAGASVRLDEGLLVGVSGHCPTPRYAAPLEIMIFTGQRNWTLPFTLVVGQAGFSDGAEFGAGAWEDPQVPWHVTTRRCHSGGASWYCGDESTWQYGNGLAAVLESPTIMCPDRAELRLWRYFNVATYGGDGLYIEARTDSEPMGEWETLDYLGSGGALGAQAAEDVLPVTCDWAELVYALDFPAGTPIKIRFRFVSDAEDAGEGFYIDDVLIAAREDIDWPTVAQGIVWPSPFEDRTFLQFALPSPEDARLDVLDVSGRQVRALLHDRLAAGDYRFLWDGRDGRGERVPAGVYFLQLDAGQHSRSWRVMHIR